MSFGEKLLEFRKEKEISQEDFAIDSEVSQSSISNYKSGFTKPNIFFLEKISDYFSIPLEEFFVEDKPT